MNKALLQVGARAACLVIFVTSMAQADEYNYDLMILSKLDNGQKVEMLGLPMTDFFECLHAKKKVQIGHKFPRVNLIDANGKSFGGTIVGARCVQRLHKMGE